MKNKIIAASIAALAIASLCAAQTNSVGFKSITVGQSPTLSNDFRITMVLTNLVPDKEYELVIARRLQDPWSYYIVFSSPSNSITILRDTRKTILTRFYAVEGDDGVSGSELEAGSVWDEVDLPVVTEDPPPTVYSTNHVSPDGLPLPPPPRQP